MYAPLFIVLVLVSVFIIWTIFVKLNLHVKFGNLLAKSKKPFEKEELKKHIEEEENEKNV